MPAMNDLDIRRLYSYEVWRLFTSQCIFSNMAQTFIGMLLMYICRQFERQFGSRKYGGFVLLSFILSVLMQFLVVTITGAADLDFTPAHGPFFLIFSLLPLFYCKLACFDFWISSLLFAALIKYIYYTSYWVISCWCSLCATIAVDWIFSAWGWILREELDISAWAATKSKSGSSQPATLSHRTAFWLPVHQECYVHAEVPVT